MHTQNLISCLREVAQWQDREDAIQRTYITIWLIYRLLTLPL